MCSSDSELFIHMTQVLGYMAVQIEARFPETQFGMWEYLERWFGLRFWEMVELLEMRQMVRLLVG